MNYKQKCLDIFYASDLVNKELMFGCEVYIPKEQCKGVMSGYYHEGENRHKDRLNVSFTDSGHYPFDKNTHKIIGHPPQLQDWLALLGGREYLVIGTARMHPWNFVVDTTGQAINENGMHLMKFNLTTGQPATEADWKALYELIK